MPKCRLCRYEYDDEARYCPQCGVRLDELESSSAPTSAEWETTEELLELSKALSSTLDLQLLLRKIDASAVKLIGAVAGSIMLFNEDKSSLRFRSSCGEKAEIVRTLSVQDGIAWWVAQHGQTARVNDTSVDERYTGTIDKITGFKTKKALCVPMILEDEVVGVIEVLNKVDGTDFSDEDERLLSVLANQAAVAVKNARLATEQRNFFSHVIEILVKAIESTYLVAEGHCWEVARLAIAVGRKLGMKDQELQALYHAAALHDIGILSLRQDDSELINQIDSLPVLGANMVKTIDMLRATEPLIRHHREYFAGGGFPDGLKGEEIPLGARIIAVVNRYEEEISRGKDHELVKDELQENAGTAFDPEVVDVFLELVNVYQY